MTIETKFVIQQLWGADVSWDLDRPSHTFYTPNSGKPNSQLFKTLQKAPDKLTVGLSTLDPEVIQKGIEADGQLFTFDRTFSPFWEAVARQAQDFGHKVVYLDEAEVYGTYAAMIMELQAWEEGEEKVNHLVRSRRGADRWRAVQQRDCIRRAKKMASLKSDYTAWVLRRERMLDNIEAHQPQIVVMERDYADYLVLANGLLDLRRGMVVREYKTDRKPEWSTFESIDELERDYRRLIGMAS